MPKILIADDQSAMRQLVRMTLETGRFEILEAGDGPAALDVARREVPDLVFLDWTMPGMAGVDVCRELRGDARTASIPVVMLTARTQEFDRAAAREAGASDYMTKPFSPFALLEKVREVLGRNALM